MRRHLSISFLFIVALIGSLTQHVVPTLSADDIPPFYTADVGPITLPPGESSTGGQTTLMLELSDGADSDAVAAVARDSGATIIYHTRLVYRGIAVSAPGAMATQLRSIPGVAGVHLLPAKQRLRTRSATPTKMVATIPARSTLTGTGVRIGIIDSGIDYTHATFGGAGTPAAFDANDPTIIESGSFPTAKVIAGYDLAGDAYDADGLVGSATANPDPDPLDCGVPHPVTTLNRGGHGTHVAATAAGYGVYEGTTYKGPFDTRPDDSAFNLPPGVAPQASLVALKVFGCRGSTALLGRAIELAIDPNGDGDYGDRLVDVLNISIGSPFGGDDDPDAQAVNKAVEAGVTVVVAVGDIGNVFYAASSPASATGAIAVGATGSDSLTRFSSRGPQRGLHTIKPDLIAPGLAIVSAASGTGTDSVAMDGTSSAAAQAAGAAALVLQRYPSWTPAKIKGALLGTAQPLLGPGGLAYPASLVGAGQLDLSQLDKLRAVAYVDGNPAPGSIAFAAPWLTGPWRNQQQLTIYNAESHTRIVELQATTTVSETGVTVAVTTQPIEVPARSSIHVPVQIAVDPASLDETPDALTPAMQGILDRYAMNEHSGAIQITSSSTYARVRSAHAAKATALTVTLDGRTLQGDITAGQIAEYQTVIAGRRLVRVIDPVTGNPVAEREVVLNAGLDYTFLVSGSGTALAVSLIETPRQTPSDALIQAFNANPGDILEVCVDDRLIATLSYRQASRVIPITPGSHEVTFYRNGQRVAQAHIAPRSGDTLLVGIGRGNADCLNGGCSLEQMTLVGTSRNTAPPSIMLRVPFQIFPKSASDIRAATPEIMAGPGVTNLSLILRNTGARNTALSPRGSQTPLTAAFELAAESPDLGATQPALRAADIRYVGVTSNYPISGSAGGVGTAESSVLFFATASYGAWSTPNEVQHRIYIDSTGPSGVPDGTDDFVLMTVSFGQVSTQQPNDVFVSLLYRINPDGSLSWTGNPPGRYNSLPSPSNTPNVDVAPYNSSVMFQLISGRLLGLTPAQPRFRYHIETRARDAANYTEMVDRVPATGTIEYDVTAAALYPVNAERGVPNFVQRPLFIGADGGAVTTSVNPAVLAIRRQQGMLLLHLHNPPAQQAEIVSVVSTP